MSKQRLFVQLLVILAMFGIFFAAKRAQADIANRAWSPIGERQAFMANTGTGRPADTGAVYYNPAGLTDLQSTEISLSGNVYEFFELKSDSIVFVDNTNVPFKADGFATIPISFVSTQRFGAWTGALSILVPESYEINNRVPFSTPNTNGSIVASSRNQDLWVGLSGARKISDRWSAGLSLFLIRHTQASVFQTTIDSNSSANFISSLARTDLSVWGISPTFGLSYEANDKWMFGLRLQAPLIQLSGEADVYQEQRSNVSTAVTNDELGRKANFEMPFDMTLGTSFMATQKLELLADVSLQAGTEYDQLPGSDQNTHFDTKWTPRVNTGFEWFMNEKYSLRGGAFFNPSSNRSLSVADDVTQKEDFYGLSLGGSSTSKNVRTGVGLFYTWTSGTAIPEGAPDARTKIRSQIYGALLSTAYVF